MVEPIQYGRYQLIKKLAAGGMAQVWLARQSGIEGFEKLLVIKQVLPHLAGTGDFMGMFLDEARLVARLNHPNVVQVFDLGQEDETLYIAMEYVHGEDLRRVDRESRQQRRPIPIPLVCRIIADAAAGLHYAHTQTSPDGRPLGIVHRDVSPQNILVTFEGGVKVVDFGIAKAADKATKTRAGVLKGKYAYMSPEQATGKDVDARTDVFALGIMLHELLTGRRLFKRPNELATLGAVVRDPIAPPSSLNPVVPPELDPVVMRALTRDRDQRYPDAGSLQLDLEDFLTSQRLAASSAHLRRYMREVFTDRLDAEARDGGPEAYLLEHGTGSGTSRSRGFAPGTVAPDMGPAEAFRELPTRSENRPKTPAPEHSKSLSLSVAIEEESEDETTPIEESLGSASRVMQGLERRRHVLLGLAGASLVAGGLFVGLQLFGDKETQPARVAAVGSGQGVGSEDAPPVEPAASPTEPTENPTATEAPADPRPSEPAVAAADPTPEVADPEPAAPEASAGPEAPAEPEKPATPAPGRLQVQISPAAADVFVKAGSRWRKIGREARLRPGSHRLKVVLPGGATHLEGVSVPSGRATTFSRSYAQGQLKVLITQPFGMGGRVRIGGKELGRIPGRPISLYEGSYTVEVVSEGGDRTVKKKVTVRPGQDQTLTIQFD